MTATLHEKKNRPNYYALIRYKESGKECVKTISTGIPIRGNNKRKAEERKDEIFAEFKASVQTQKIDINKNPLFTDFFKGWLETRKKTKNIADTTHESYLLTQNVHILPFFEPLGLHLKDVEPQHIQEYVNKKLEKVSPNSVKKHLANLSSCFESAMRQSIIAFNPVKRIEEVKKVKFHGAKFLQESEIEKMLSCFKGDPLEIVILLTLWYGLRRSEILGIKWGAIDFTRNTLAIKHTVVTVTGKIHRKDLTKNDSSYAVLPLLDGLKAHLLRWKDEQARRKALQPNDYYNGDSEYVCTAFNGELFKPDYVSKHFKLIMKDNGLQKIRFHDLRHSAGTYLKYLGFDLRDIQAWLRHADIKTTSQYAHMDLSAKAPIAAKLNEKLSKMGL